MAAGECNYAAKGCAVSIDVIVVSIFLYEHLDQLKYQPNTDEAIPSIVSL